MSEINIFELSQNNIARELESTSVYIEKQLQLIVEKNMETLFGVKFVASEYRIENGRMDSIGIDENYCPVIFEYKRSSSENVINQGLFYMDWLISHKDSFFVLVMKNCGKEIADKIEWTMPRLCCIANNFTKFDENAIRQMARNISLYRYKIYDHNLILLELLGSNTPTSVLIDEAGNTIDKKNVDVPFSTRLSRSSKTIQILYENLKTFILSLGDDISENPLKLYVAFKKIKNIACVEVHSTSIVMYLRLKPDSVHLQEGFTRDMRNIGHWGTGDLEVIINTDADFEKAQTLIEQTYNEN